MAGELGQQTVDLGAMVRRAAEESYLALRELVEKSRAEAEAEAQGKEGVPQRSDTEKKIDLLKFVDRTRQRMLRLHVLAKWCQQVPLVHYCQQLASTLSSHETCFTQTADSLFFMHEGLQQARAPIFDVPFATEVLRTGSYRRLPKCIEEIGTQNTLFQDERKPTLKKLNALVRAKLLETTLPKEISGVSVTDGVADVHVDGEFKVLLTLGYRGHFSLWRILHMELLVGEKNGPIKLEETRRYALGDDIERRMAVADNPFMILHTILHELCISLVMDTVIRQANVLRQGRWKDAIKSELISDNGAAQSGNNAPVQLGQDGELDSGGFKIPGLKLNYWVDEKSSGSAEPDLSPFIKIEAGKDMLINCLHSSFILDPLTDKEADLSLDLSCIDVEGLILKAITCNRHTRLLEIQRDLSKKFRVSQSPTDFVLKRGVHVESLQKKVDGRNSENSCTNEVLQVRAYGQSYIHLGIDIRSGRLLLQSSKNILPPSALLEFEEVLNNGSPAADKVFDSLRTRSILHLFAATGRFLGLKVHSQSQVTIKIPKSVLYGTDFIVMGFPQFANAYYLLVQLDNDLRPVFHLLETWTDGSNKSNADANGTIRFNKIDISHMHIDENEYSVNLFNAEKLHALQSVVNYNRNDEVKPLRQSGIDELLPLVPSFSPFPSVVDEVFGDKQSSSTVQNHHLASYSLHSMHLSSIQAGLEGVSGTVGLPELDRSMMHYDLNMSKATPGTNAFSSKSGHDLNSLRSTSGYYNMDGSKSPQLVSSHGQQVLRNISAEKSGGVSRKRSLSEYLLKIPSLQQSIINDRARKRRKVPESMQDGVLYKAYSSSAQPGNTVTYGNILTEGTHCVKSSFYASLLRHVIKHCSLCIKYAQLTSQMDSLGIPYVEEVGLQTPSSNLWLRLPFPKGNSWKHVCLHLGKTGSMSWEVRINDPYYGSLWKLYGGCTTTEWGVGVRISNTSEIDSHITFDDDGVVLAYRTVEADSIQRLVSDLQRLLNARAFSCGIRRLIGVKVDDKLNENGTPADTKLHPSRKGSKHRLSEQLRKNFRIEAVGLMRCLFSYGAVPVVHFVVEWEAGGGGCTVHVSPDQLWPHTKFLEDFVNVGEVASFLDCIRLTAGPLLALNGAIRPAKMPVTVPTGYGSVAKQNNIPSQGAPANDSSSATMQNVSAPPGPSMANLQTSALSSAGRGGPGLAPSSSLPFDVSVALRGPYWIRVIYRKIFSVDIRCFAGDQVWLQPATPPKGGPSKGGSLPCPQFRPFIMEHVAQGLNAFEPSFMNARHSGAQLKMNANMASGSQQSAPAPNRFNGAHAVSTSRSPSSVGNQVAASFNRAGTGMMSSSKYVSGIVGAPAHLSPGTNLPVHMKGELNSAFTGLGDDGGYGGAWVPLAALKKVLRGILKYLGVLWLFSQFPELLKEILGSVLKENEGALLNLDQEQPALRFFVGGYVFAVSVQRVQLLLQVLNVKRFHHQQQQQQQQQQQSQSLVQDELTTSEINEICDYFSRRVACEPYDASRVASFITLLTLPIPVLREFVKLIAWKKSQSQALGEAASSQRARVELCLEKHQGSVPDDLAEGSSSLKSNITHDRANHSVYFGLTFVLDNALIHHMSVSGGASWLPYCVSVRLRYTFIDNCRVLFIAMEGSHGGKACWSKNEDWERCKQMVVRAVETINGSSATGDTGQGRLRMAAEMIHKQLQLSLQQLRDLPISGSSNTS